MAIASTPMEIAIERRAPSDAMTCGRIERAEKRARAPSCIQPAIADGAGVKYVVAERRGHHHSGQHRAQK